MHDIKFIRDNFDIFKKKISQRNNTIKIENILDIDKKNRQLIQQKALNILREYILEWDK